MQYLSKSHEVSTSLVNQFLTEFFEGKINSANEIDQSYSQLWQHIKTVVMHGGKRIRPYLTFVSFSQNTNKQKIIPVAAAQELLHAGLLMIDDIIDRDYTRHGADNLIGAYRHNYAELNELDRTHFANSMTMLAGNLLIISAHDLIRQSEFSSSQKLNALQSLNHSIFETAGGELMDVEASFIVKKPSAITIAKYKTASYSFIGPLVMGAELAGESAELISSLKGFALNLGIAFQLQDDLLGVFGDSSATGKSDTSDLQEAKHTYLIEQYKNHQDYDDKLFNKVFGVTAVEQEDIDKLKQSLIDSGAKKRTEKAAADYAERSLEFLDPINNTHPIKSELINLSKLITTRNA